ncbi:hypothetical protein EKE94_05505 [Mesobaculum littorinae]|uniref:Uncharacterized protein n=1 Tax=Mesobaculum littorinae TaxID=2486419 RepID=A0A438AI50_9RHOB|nr:hypothetical protein [Mesobaculum littorinae]RVV98380.1 hypothetical protein EKE94_05505 [Mesobaculum littorinae]
MKDGLSNHAKAMRVQLYTKTRPFMGRLGAVERALDELLQHQGRINVPIREADRRVGTLIVWGALILVGPGLISSLFFATVLLIAQAGGL